jgi:hypothetical protein
MICKINLSFQDEEIRPYDKRANYLSGYAGNEDCFQVYVFGATFPSPIDIYKPVKADIMGQKMSNDKVQSNNMHCILSVVLQRVHRREFRTTSIVLI